MNPRRPEQPRIPAVDVDCATQFQLYFTTLWNLGMWGAMVFDDESEFEVVVAQYGLGFLAILIGISYLLQLGNLRQQFNHRAKPVADEVKENPPAGLTLSLESDPHSFKVQERRLICSNEHKSEYKKIGITWTIGEGTLYKHLHRIFGLFDRVSKQTKSYEFPERPVSRKKSLVYFSGNIDMASKGRAFELSGGPGFLAGRAIASYLKFNTTPYIIFVGGYTLASWLIGIRESSLLNRLDSQTKLEGYTYRFPDYCSCPPTCMGQQAARKIAFYPHNSLLNESIEYFYRSEKLLRILQSDNRLLQQMDSPTRDQITQFEFIIHEISERESEEHIEIVTQPVPIGIPINDSMLFSTQTTIAVTAVESNANTPLLLKAPLVQDEELTVRQQFR